MSIWVDMIKYNKKNKIFTLSQQGVQYTEEFDVNVTEGSETFTKIASFIPELDGIISGIVIYLTNVGGGAGSSIAPLVLRLCDVKGNILAETKEAYTTLSFGEIEVKSFEKYEIFFKNTKGITAVTKVPEKIVFNYNVVESNKFLRFNVER